MKIRTFLTGSAMVATLLLAACQERDDKVPPEMNAATELNMMNANAEEDPASDTMTSDQMNQMMKNAIKNEDIVNAAMANAG